MRLFLPRQLTMICNLLLNGMRASVQDETKQLIVVGAVLHERMNPEEIRRRVSE